MGDDRAPMARAGRRSSVPMIERLTYRGGIHALSVATALSRPNHAAPVPTPRMSASESRRAAKDVIASNKTSVHPCWSAARHSARGGDQHGKVIGHFRIQPRARANRSLGRATSCKSGANRNRK